MNPSFAELRHMLEVGLAVKDRY